MVTLKEELINYYSRKVRITGFKPDGTAVTEKIGDSELTRGRTDITTNIGLVLRREARRDLFSRLDRFSRCEMNLSQTRPSLGIGIKEAPVVIDRGLVQFLSFTEIDPQQIERALRAESGLLNNAKLLRYTQDSWTERKYLVERLRLAEHYRLPVSIADSLYHTPTLRLDSFPGIPKPIMFFEFQKPIPAQRPTGEQEDLTGILLGPNKEVNLRNATHNPDIPFNRDDMAVIPFYVQDMYPIQDKYPQVTPDFFWVAPSKIPDLAAPGAKIQGQNRATEDRAIEQIDMGPTAKLVNLVSNLLVLLTVRNLRIQDIQNGYGTIHDLNIIPRQRKKNSNQSNLLYQEIVRGCLHRYYCGLPEKRESYVVMLEPYVRGPEKAPIKKGQEKLFPLYHADLLHYADYHV